VNYPGFRRNFLIHRETCWFTSFPLASLTLAFPLFFGPLTVGVFSGIKVKTRWPEK